MQETTLYVNTKSNPAVPNGAQVRSNSWWPCLESTDLGTDTVVSAAQLPTTLLELCMGTKDVIEVSLHSPWEDAGLLLSPMSWALEHQFHMPQVPVYDSNLQQLSKA
jgi:hypothetical protein